MRAHRQHPSHHRCRERGGWRRSARGLLLILAALGFVLLPIFLAPVHAVEPGEMLKDPVLEARARHLSQELRCLVCQNQSIDDSNAELARDLRLLVRERLVAGDSDAAVLAFVEARYGEFALLRPRLRWHTLLLWLTPPLLLGAVAIALFLRMQGRRADSNSSRQSAPLSPQERERLDDLLKRTSG